MKGELSDAIAPDSPDRNTISRDRLPSDWGRGGIPEPDDSGSSEPCSDAVQIRPELDCGTQPASTFFPNSNNVGIFGAQSEPEKRPFYLIK